MVIQYLLFCHSFLDFYILSILQLILFTTSHDTEKFYPVFREAAKLFKGKVRNYLSVSSSINIYMLLLFSLTLNLSHRDSP